MVSSVQCEVKEGYANKVKGYAKLLVFGQQIVLHELLRDADRDIADTDQLLAVHDSLDFCNHVAQNIDFCLAACGLLGLLER